MLRLSPSLCISTAGCGTTSRSARTRLGSNLADPTVISQVLTNHGEYASDYELRQSSLECSRTRELNACCCASQCGHVRDAWHCAEFRPNAKPWFWSCGCGLPSGLLDHSTHYSSLRPNSDFAISPIALLLLLRYGFIFTAIIGPISQAVLRLSPNPTCCPRARSAARSLFSNPVLRPARRVKKDGLRPEQAPAGAQ